MTLPFARIEASGHDTEEWRDREATKAGVAPNPPGVTMEQLNELADIIDESAAEAMAWARSGTNDGPWSEEFYRTHCQISSVLGMIATRLRTQASKDSQR